MLNHNSVLSLAEFQARVSKLHSNNWSQFPMLGAEKGEGKHLGPTVTRNEAQVFLTRQQSYQPFMGNWNWWGGVGRAWALVSDTLWLQSSHFHLESRQFNLSKFFKFPVHLSPCAHLCLGDYNSYIKELLWELQGVKYPSVWQIVSRHSNVQFFHLPPLLEEEQTI